MLYIAGISTIKVDNKSIKLKKRNSLCMQVVCGTCDITLQPFLK